MSKEFIGGTLAVAALGSILIFHGIKHEESKRVFVPVPISNPAPATATPDVAVKCTVEHPCHTVKAEGTPKHPVYRKVLRGGKLDGPVTCKQVPQVAREYPPDKVIAFAKGYGLTPQQLGELRLCLN